MSTYLQYLVVCMICLLCCEISIAQSTPAGIWKTIDDATGEAKSYVEIFEKDGKWCGKVIELLQDEPSTVCEKCPGAKKDQLVVGMEIMWDLQPYKDYWSYGRVLDPENGKTYKCSIWLTNGNTLKIRGYIGISALGRNQNWYRVK